MTDAGDPTTDGRTAELAVLTPAATWCDRCGADATAGPHPGCATARVLEPPRYCAHCRRRMKVQVLPVGWSAVCVAHGERRG